MELNLPEKFSNFRGLYCIDFSAAPFAFPFSPSQDHPHFPALTFSRKSCVKQHRRNFTISSKISLFYALSLPHSLNFLFGGRGTMKMCFCFISFSAWVEDGRQVAFSTFPFTLNLLLRIKMVWYFAVGRRRNFSKTSSTRFLNWPFWPFLYFHRGNGESIWN